MQVGLYNIFFYFGAFVHESINLLVPHPTCVAHTIALLLHDYCAMYDPPSTPLVYAIHHTVLAMGISCKVQLVPLWQPGGGSRCAGESYSQSVVRAELLSSSVGGIRVGLYTILRSPIVYGVWHKRRRGRWGAYIAQWSAIVML